MGQIKREILKDETHEDSNCFVLTVICHGNNKGHLLDRNRIKGWVLEDFIGDLSLVESLAGRPKLLVIQSCRGGIQAYPFDIFLSFRNCTKVLFKFYFLVLLLTYQFNK